MAGAGHPPIGTRLWFPALWECGTLDSVLEGNNGQVIAFVIRKDDGTLTAVDMQVTEVDEQE
jgi:hypothetical protein